MATQLSPASVTDAAIRAYWDQRIHDTQLSTDAYGSLGFFEAMDAYRYGRSAYLPELIHFDRWRGRDVLDIGCGAGLDVVRFARSGARVCGVELSDGALSLARQYLKVANQRATLVQADAARLPFPDAAFDLVFCHSVLPFACDCAAIVAEAWRVLREDGLAILMVYNRHSWLYALRTLHAVELGHADAPVFRTHTRQELDALLTVFGERTITSERLPAPTHLHRGWKGFLINRLVMPGMRLIPQRWIRPFGWHLIALCRKGPVTGPPRRRDSAQTRGTWAVA